MINVSSYFIAVCLALANFAVFYGVVPLILNCGLMLVKLTDKP